MTWMPASPAHSLWNPSLVAESWLPLVMTTDAPASRICRMALLSTSKASRAGVAESKMSPDTTTTSTDFSRTMSASASSTVPRLASVE